MSPRIVAGCMVAWLCSVPSLAAEGSTARLHGRIIDAENGQVLPARIYIRSANGRWFFPKSAAAEGSAVEYRRDRPATSAEMHTTLSAHPFVVDLPPGKYAVHAERGKEYLPADKEVVVADKPVEVEIKLKRWIHMAQRGWYSGDIHSHRTVAETPNVMLAEDLNVSLPLTYWVTTSHTGPKTGNRVKIGELRPEPVHLDQTHLYYPLNTEYEIFSVQGKAHTLGAVLILGHKTPLEMGVPPVRAVADHARREGALLDLEKHTWPWSAAVVPIMNIDLFELANNHVWRTLFGFPKWTIDTAPRYMNLDMDAQGFTEWGWIDFGFKTYYALLNSGFRLRPGAGTASGVHPVPLGFGRVYVYLGAKLDFSRWMQALNAGHSFVTTGPMLQVKFNGQLPGHTFTGAQPGTTCEITGTAESAVPLDGIEVVVNGRVAKTLKPQNAKTENGGLQSAIKEAIKLDGSGWICVRVFERSPDRRIRFAHTAPVFIDVPGKPLPPRREEVAYLIERVQEEIRRNENVLTLAAVAEYRQALRVYEALAEKAR